jgi:hypothetical protein
MSDKMGIGTLIDLEKFVDLRFAEAVYADLEIQRRPSLFQKPSDIVNRLISRHR